MRDEYDLKNMKKAKPQYLKYIKESVTMRMNRQVIDYFKELAQKKDIPYQTLINYVLHEYAEKGLEPSANWGEESKKKK